MLANNPLYIQHEISGVKIYVPSDVTTGYHKSRELAMAAQERYSSGGISKQLLQAMCGKALEMINKQNALDTLRTDMSVLWNNLRARTEHPVDEYCAVRMGAIGCFVEGEDPDRVIEVWTNRKMAFAAEHPDIFTFFLNWGVALTPEYSSLLRGLSIQDYLTEREQMMQQMLPSSLNKELKSYTSQPPSPA